MKEDGGSRVGPMSGLGKKAGGHRGLVEESKDGDQRTWGLLYR